MCTWPHFESEGFWNSEVAYNCVFCKSRHTTNVCQVESLIRDFSNAGRHEHSFISATGIKSRTDLAQTAGKDRRNRDQVDSRVCASTLLWTAYINGVMPFYFIQNDWENAFRRCPAQIQSGPLVGYRVQRNVFPHKMRMKMCISVIRWFSLKW